MLVFHEDVFALHPRKYLRVGAYLCAVLLIRCLYVREVHISKASMTIY
jgi:hypothetical protein